MTSGGSRANTNGGAAETIIAALLSHRGYDYQRQAHIGRSIFDKVVRADFFIPHTPPFPNGLIIESKWQQSSGSAEEKLCYLVLNVNQVYPCPVIVVADGDGFTLGALRWLRAQAGIGRLHAVLNIAEFVTWSNTHL